MKKNIIIIIGSLLCILFNPVSCSFAQSIGEPRRDSEGPNPVKNVYFGEEHIHTSASPDAFAIGARGTWEDAYNYAMGKEIKLSTTGETIKRSTPLDFIGITDHAEYLDVLPMLVKPGSALSGSTMAKLLADDPVKAVNVIIGSLISGVPNSELIEPTLLFSNWQRYKEVANTFNKPGEFTTFVAWEWTSIPDGRNMHRNVFFRDEGPGAPFTAFDSVYPEDLWTFQEIPRTLGHDNIAIPHNGNVSDGWMYAHNKFLEGPIDARYARRQQRNEPLTEIIQSKGQSETHPHLSPNDEFANFELFQNLINVGAPGAIKYSYIRQGLVLGMIIEDQVGYNPYKFGFAAGSDSHSAYSPNEEFNFNGSHAMLDDTPAKRLSPNPNASGDLAGAVGSGGITAVWAEENTRESIFDAMKNKEAYGTSGTLIRVRFFGGWAYPANLVNEDFFIAKAYIDGVPMGQDLRTKPKTAKAPTFVVWALKDPESGNLDRIQIVKGFVDKWGRPNEKIYDVVWSDDRKIDSKTGKLPSVGNTVNIKKATYTNSIGDSQLSVVWTDPDFNPEKKAVYYVRVLEIPTPRWSTYDAAKSGVAIPEGLPATIQERAWSSPIWYTPQ
jgi:hypothetical protein